MYKICQNNSSLKVLNITMHYSIITFTSYLNNYSMQYDNNIMPHQSNNIIPKASGGSASTGVTITSYGCFEKPDALILASIIPVASFPKNSGSVNSTSITVIKV